METHANLHELSLTKQRSDGQLVHGNTTLCNIFNILCQKREDNNECREAEISVANVPKKFIKHVRTAYSKHAIMRYR